MLRNVVVVMYDAWNKHEVFFSWFLYNFSRECFLRSSRVPTSLKKSPAIRKKEQHRASVADPLTVRENRRNVR